MSEFPILVVEENGWVVECNKKIISGTWRSMLDGGGGGLAALVKSLETNMRV